jgi:hypothetical protein
MNEKNHLSVYYGTKFEFDNRTDRVRVMACTPSINEDTISDDQRRSRDLPWYS